MRIYAGFGRSGQNGARDSNRHPRIVPDGICEWQNATMGRVSLSPVVLGLANEKMVAVPLTTMIAAEMLGSHRRESRRQRHRNRNRGQGIRPSSDLSQQNHPRYEIDLDNNICILRLKKWQIDAISRYGLVVEPLLRLSGQPALLTS